MVEVGCAGMNLEDCASKEKNQPRRLVDLSEQLAKIGALLEAKRLLRSEFFLNARVDALTVMADDTKRALEGRSFEAMPMPKPVLIVFFS